jgi:hypothetical protein
MPTFLILAAMKSGTTAMYELLRDHPQVFMSALKEPQHFACSNGEPGFAGPGDTRTRSFVVTDPDEYAALFADAGSARAIGEASTWYLYVPEAARRIRRVLPDALLLVLLRNPADRAYSSFLHMCRDGREPVADFAAALEDEPRRIQEGWAPHWHYRAAGLYSGQLRRYFEHFDRARIQIHLYDELVHDPAALTRDVLSFLNVDTACAGAIGRHNISGRPRSHALQSFLRERHPALRRLVPERLRRGLVADLLRRNTAPAPSLDPGLRQELLDFYREDVLALQDLIDRDLSGWLAD